MSKKNISKMSNDVLYAKLRDLKTIVYICESYLKSCPNTFLGPLGARAEIKRCNKKIALINAELDKRYIPE